MDKLDKYLMVVVASFAILAIIENFDMLKTFCLNLKKKTPTVKTIRNRVLKKNNSKIEQPKSNKNVTFHDAKKQYVQKSILKNKSRPKEPTNPPKKPTKPPTQTNMSLNEHDTQIYPLHTYNDEDSKYSFLT